MENLQLKDQLEKSEEKQRVLQEQMRRSSLVEKTSFDNVQQFQLEAAHKKIELLEAILQEKKEGVKVIEWSIECLRVVKLFLDRAYARSTAGCREVETDAVATA